MSDFRPEAIYRPKGSVVRREIAGESLLVPLSGPPADMQRLFSINPAASCIWQSLDGKRDLAAVRDAVLARFETTHAAAEADIAIFLAQLIEADLVEEVT
jgi:hypothetical protein